MLVYLSEGSAQMAVSVVVVVVVVVVVCKLLYFRGKCPCTELITHLAESLH